MGRKAKKETPTVLLVTALDGTFNKQAWADHFAATLHANARETKSQADILRAICAAYKLFQLFFNSCGDDVGNAYNQKCIKQAVAAIKAAAELMEIGEIWTVKMKRAMSHLSSDALDRESFASAVDDNWQMFKGPDDDVKAIFEPPEHGEPEPPRKKPKSDGQGSEAGGSGSDDEDIVQALGDLTAEVKDLGVLLGGKLDRIAKLLEKKPAGP